MEKDRKAKQEREERAEKARKEKEAREYSEAVAKELKEIGIVPTVEPVTHGRDGKPKRPIDAVTEKVTSMLDDEEMQENTTKEDPKLFDYDREIILADLWNHGPKWYFN